MEHTLKSLLMGLAFACSVNHANAENFTSKITPTHSGDSFQFILSLDSMVTLTPTLTGELTAGNSGFYISTLRPNDPSYSSTHDVVRSEMPATGDTRGPWPLKAGTYFLSLWNNNWNTGSYTAKLDMVPPTTANDNEPNDTPALAKVLPLNSTTTGLLGFYGALDDKNHDYGDYYRLTLPGKGVLNFNDEKDSTLGSAFGYSLYQADGTTSIYDPRSELDAGDYILLAWTNSGSAYGSYRLQVGFTPSASIGGLSASASSLSFGNQEVGSTTTQSITLSNTGRLNAAFSSITASADFRISDNTCVPSLAPGANCKLTINFEPTTTGAQTSTLSIVTDIDNLNIDLSGTGFVTSAPGVGEIHVLTPPVSARDFSPLLAFAPAVGARDGSYNLYIAGLYQGQFYFLSVRNWQMTIIAYFGGEMPVYQVADGAALYGTGESGTGMQTWNIPLGDISSLTGLQVYAGFGRTEEDMINRNQVKLIYTVE